MIDGGLFRSLVLGAALAGSLVPAAARAAQQVDLELVLAVDVSGSIDEEEARLQRQGYVAAFRSPEVAAAIGSGRHRRIAVTYVEWAGFEHQSTIIGWTLIRDRASALKFAALLAEANRMTGPYTSISGAIDFAVPLFAQNDFEAPRRVIDISGDGPNNSGRYVLEARREALAAGVTINGLPIINDRPSRYGSIPMRNLDLYYKKCVIGGPGAFIVVANTFSDFGRAIRKKLILEIVGREPGHRGTRLAAAAPRWHAAPERKAPPCNAGERRRRGWEEDNY